MSSSTEGLVFLDGLDAKLKPALLDSLLKYDLALLLFSFPKALVQIDGQILNVKLILNYDLIITPFGTSKRISWVDGCDILLSILAHLLSSVFIRL